MLDEVLYVYFEYYKMKFESLSGVRSLGYWFYFLLVGYIFVVIYC